jgi:hypothetical protein
MAFAGFGAKLMMRKRKSRVLALAAMSYLFEGSAVSTGSSQANDRAITPCATISSGDPTGVSLYSN